MVSFCLKYDDEAGNLPQNKLYIVPNPAKDVIRLEGKDADKITYIKIFDLKGKVVYSGNKNEMEISALMPANYILHVELQDGSVKYLKLVKQ
ncbi:MAG: T9SS type A sorting domain-containing protein [Bacteroidales bacterium]|nr:T9SS type A sorting domain-containing protein [Bacteroidales bacterium]